MHPSALTVSVLAAALVLSACSFSYSSKSGSTSSASLGKLASSPSLASSRSSETPQQTYEREVSDFTAEFVKSTTGDMQGFRTKVGKLAQDSGITNWQADRTSYVAIGKGLRQAGLNQPQFEAFRQSLGDSEKWKMDAITEGFGK